MSKPILIAAAWPYANGSLHLGHVAGLIAGDVLARYHRQKGDRVLYVSGSDCHGTPIAVEAEKQGTSPKIIAEKYHAEFLTTLIDGLKFSYDNFTTTMTATHERVVQEMFLKLLASGHIEKKIESLPYSEVSKRFLPDRYLEGTCPICGFTSARGDQCDNCSNLLNPKQLINPKSKIDGDTPVWRDSEHFYLKLGHFIEPLKQFIAEAFNWRANAVAFSKNLVNDDIPDRAITRDTDWGITIPVPGYEDKKIYVWFEAVCGYLSASVEWAEKHGRGEDWAQWWRPEHGAYHYYVHGKDNIPFHTVIWPAMLIGHGALKLPDSIVSSELYNLEGQQFSKSRNWAVWVKDVLQDFSADSVRHYLIANGPESSDADFRWADFQSRHNSDLVGTWGNFANRVYTLIHKNFENKIPAAELLPQDKFVLDLISKTYAEVGKLIEATKLREAERTALELVAAGNRYINDQQPWKLINSDRARAGTILNVCAQIAANSARLLEPFMPIGSNQLSLLYGVPDLRWQTVILEAGQSLAIEASLLYQPILDEQIELQNNKLEHKKSRV